MMKKVCKIDLEALMMYLFSTIIPILQLDSYKLSHWFIGSHEHFMLKVSYWDQSMSAISRQQFALNDNFSYITGSILTKLHRNVPWVTPCKNS